jgi:NitT/TauT family transport system ATP-binding protein
MGAELRPVPMPAALALDADAAADPRPSIFRRPHVTVRGLTKRFDDRVIYEKFDLDLPRGKFVSIFGPNGCGKSTLMNMIAGLIPVDQGEILFDGQTIQEIRFGYVFQNYRDALFPWISAWDNIAYPLRFMKVPKAERNRRVDALVKKFDIRLNLKQYPYQMSGGQQQLVSILRALVVEPEILFLDEPFSALDYEMTLFMRDQMQRMFQETGTTTIIVSHDLDEAVYLADRILLLSRAPTRVVDFPLVDAPRPRTALTLADPEFNRIKGHCLEIFQQQVRV